MSSIILLAVVSFATRLSPVHAAAPIGLFVYGAYADTHHPPSNGMFPSPWSGSPNVNFIGTPSNWDAGAIRLDNSTTASITGVQVTVDIGSSHYDLWGADLTIPANDGIENGLLILTETASDNFDVSDFSPNLSRGTCSPASSDIPIIHVTIGSTTTDYQDVAQSINTGGVDAVVCPPPGPNDESRPWTAMTLGSSTAASPTPAATPTPITPTIGTPITPNTSTGIFYVDRIAQSTLSTSSSGLTLPVATTGVAAGHSILIALMLGNVGSLTAPISATDSAGNVYSVDRDVNDGSGGDRTVIISSPTTKALTGGNTISIAYPSAGQAWASADEFGGVAARDQGAGASNTSTGFSSGMTSTTTQANELLFGTVGIQSGSPPTWASGWTVTPNLAIAPDDLLRSAFAVVGTTGRYAASGNSGGTWMAAIQTYTADPQPPAPNDAAPSAGLTVAPASGSAPLLVTADASTSTDTDATPIATYKFDFGDGTLLAPGPAATASHTYAGAGSFTVTVTVTDTAGLASSKTATVTVSDSAPVAALSVSPTSGAAPLTVTADASASMDKDATPIATYEFDFGDGTVPAAGSAATASHTYPGAGRFTVTVTVTDTAGLASSKTATVTVSDSAPLAILSVSPMSGTAPLTVTADATASTDKDTTPIRTYTFDFGDGTAPVSGAAATASHTYTRNGTFTVTLTVADTAGLTATRSAAVTLGDSPPLAALSVSPSSGGAPLSVTADASASTDTDTTPIATYKFDFGDGTVVGPQSTATAGHTYGGGGAFVVTVTVIDTAGLFAIKTSSVAVSDSAPVAALTVSPASGMAPLIVTVDASASTDTDTTPIATYKFDFGDGTLVGPQSAPTATHTYTGSGTFSVVLTVADTAGLSAMATAAVTVRGSNLVGNPGFETDMSGWNTAGISGVTLARVSTTAHSGKWSAQLTNTSSSPQYCILNDSPNWVARTVAGTYTASIWVRADSAGATVKLKIREYANGNTTLVGQNSTIATLSSSWRQLTVTYVPVSPGSTLDFQVYAPNAAAGASFYADDASITVA